MKNAAQPSSARARAAARHIGTYDTSVLVARMTRIRSDAGSRAMAGLLVALFCPQTRRTPCKRDRDCGGFRMTRARRSAILFMPFSGPCRTVSVQIEIPKRALFKASEVCDLAKVQPYVLRSWEAEFPDLGVAKAAGGPRVYRRTDVEQVAADQAPAARRRPDAGGRAAEARRGRRAGGGRRAGHRRARRAERARAADGGQARPAVDSGPARAERRYSGVPAVAAGRRTRGRAPKPAARAKAPRRRPRAGQPASGAEVSLAALIDSHVASGVSRTCTSNGM